MEVKSRTSTLQYKETPKPIPDIGRELDVANILEGSVRKEGNKVRIVAQLIDVKKDVHLTPYIRSPIFIYIASLN